MFTSELVSKREQCDPVGASEIAERLSVQPLTVAKWKLRGHLPEPPWSISGNPCWNWAQIEAWARETGRLPVEDA
jgi:hypothetical protein